MFGKVNEAYDSVKKGLEVHVALATAEQKDMLASARVSLAELKDLIADLKEENRNLRERVKAKEQLRPELGFDWLIMDNDPDPSRRYCPLCFYDRDKIIPLRSPELYNGVYKRYCRACKQVIG